MEYAAVAVGSLRELDRLVAERVMGGGAGVLWDVRALPGAAAPYSSHIGHAWAVWERLLQMNPWRYCDDSAATLFLTRRDPGEYAFKPRGGYYVCVMRSYWDGGMPIDDDGVEDEDGKWNLAFYGETAPVAICVAALAAVGVLVRMDVSSDEPEAGAGPKKR